MARFISVFAPSATADVITPSPGTVAGDTVVQVFIMDPPGSTADVTTYFGRFIPATGNIAQITALTGVTLCLALLERP